MAGVTGIGQLDAMIAKLRAAAEPKQYQRAAAREIESFLRGEISAGRDPQTGKPWRPRKDGGKPLAGVKGLTVRLTGKRITITLSGHRVYHHFGATRGGVQRRQLPEQGLPAKLGNAIRAGLVPPFNKAMS